MAEPFFGATGRLVPASLFAAVRRHFIQHEPRSDTPVSGVCSVWSGSTSYDLHGPGGDSPDASETSGKGADASGGSAYDDGNDADGAFPVGNAHAADDAVAEFMQQAVHFSRGGGITYKYADDGDSFFFHFHDDLHSGRGRSGVFLTVVSLKKNPDHGILRLRV